MYRCDICNTIVQERYKTKPNQSNKNKYCSNLISNRYVLKDVEVAKFEDVFTPYFIEHTKQFSFFRVCIILRFYDDENYLDHEISVPNNVTFKIQSEHYSTHTAEPAIDSFT